MKTKDIDATQIEALLTYTPEIGGSCLTWKTKRGSRAKGSMAGRVTNMGYWQVNVQGKHYMAHRLVWTLVNKAQPPHMLDHIDGDKTNNRIENLRLAPRGQYDNMQNKRAAQNSTSSLVGVSWHKSAQKWKAQICVDRKVKHLGLFTSPEEAHAAYLQAKQQHHTFVEAQNG